MKMKKAIFKGSAQEARSTNLSIKPLVVAVALTLTFSPSIWAQQSNSKTDAASELLSGDTTKIGGYVRAMGSWNLENAGSGNVGNNLLTNDKMPSTGQDETGAMSMARGTVFLDFEAKRNQTTIKASVRSDQEVETSYLKRLNQKRAGNSVLGLNALPTGKSTSSDLMDQYNDTQIRDLYVDFPISENVQARIGKQQVVWGESDFFRAMDIVNGFDYRWRSFLEVENEELRKTNWMANFRINFPEQNGSLQAIIKPGLDRGEDIGNSYDITGGRWANNPYRGVDFYNVNNANSFTADPSTKAYLGTNYRHHLGDKKDTTGGLRWTGLEGNLNYSLAVLNGFGNPVVVPAGNSIIGSTGSTAEATSGSLGDVVFPKITAYGFTLNGYSPTFDAVFSTEQVLTTGVAYNFGSMKNGSQNPVFNIPGLDGYMKKNTVTSMFRMDKSVDLTKVIGTSRPSFGSVQVFNTHILNYNKSDDLVGLIGFTGALKQNTTWVTGILGMNYSNDRINPALAVGGDMTNGGGFIIPSVEFVLGDFWRLKAEADIFFSSKSRPQAFDNQGGNVADPGAPLMGYFHGNDQFVLRLTRNF
ncbi:LysR family transcriptional regulator [Polynucleobacter sp. 30F-ANTBAC]|uniref:DUF1302 family protein n=1 Tax=Polynucleobacter sp. 30F-ANTBAC TaxID=2689095 RepID=UPI001C0DD54E|nr:DUF1302 family protein [Polynucleobacter sp. 30F-ANTBAC]MBU3599263.1 LysR family transcriptional regulator [Polynucleobacter sp. 30F-ANTBAC]